MLVVDVVVVVVVVVMDQDEDQDQEVEACLHQEDLEVHQDIHQWGLGLALPSEISIRSALNLKNQLHEKKKMLVRGDLLRRSIWW